MKKQIQDSSFQQQPKRANLKEESKYAEIVRKSEEEEEENNSEKNMEESMESQSDFNMDEQEEDLNDDDDLQSNENNEDILDDVEEKVVLEKRQRKKQKSDGQQKEKFDIDSSAPLNQKDHHARSNISLKKEPISVSISESSEGHDVSDKTRKKWTTEEDESLKDFVNLYGEKSWSKISSLMPGRTTIQCHHRWSKILKPGLVKGPWMKEEDDKLVEWVRMFGASKWSHCSGLILGRSGKQCRERWFNNLDPNVKKGKWTILEDKSIFKGYLEFGSSWSRIARELVGRTENAVKNRFYSTVRKLLSDMEKKGRILNFSNESDIKIIVEESLGINSINFPSKLEEQKSIVSSKEKNGQDGVLNQIEEGEISKEKERDREGIILNGENENDEQVQIPYGGRQWYSESNALYRLIIQNKIKIKKTVAMQEYQSTYKKKISSDHSVEEKPADSSSGIERGEHIPLAAVDVVVAAAADSSQHSDCEIVGNQHSMTQPSSLGAAGMNKGEEIQQSISCNGDADLNLNNLNGLVRDKISSLKKQFHFSQEIETNANTNGATGTTTAAAAATTTISSEDDQDLLNFQNEIQPSIYQEQREVHQRVDQDDNMFRDIYQNDLDYFHCEDSLVALNSESKSLQNMAQALQFELNQKQKQLEILDTHYLQGTQNDFQYVSFPSISSHCPFTSYQNYLYQDFALPQLLQQQQQQQQLQQQEQQVQEQEKQQQQQHKFDLEFQNNQSLEQNLEKLKQLKSSETENPKKKQKIPIEIIHLANPPPRNQLYWDQQNRINAALFMEVKNKEKTQIIPPIQKKVREQPKNNVPVFSTLDISRKMIRNPILVTSPVAAAVAAPPPPPPPSAAVTIEKNKRASRDSNSSDSDSDQDSSSSESDSSVKCSSSPSDEKLTKKFAKILSKNFTKIIKNMSEKYSKKQLKQKQEKKNRKQKIFPKQQQPIEINLEDEEDDDRDVKVEVIKDDGISGCASPTIPVTFRKPAQSSHNQKCGFDRQSRSQQNQNNNQFAQKHHKQQQQNQQQKGSSSISEGKIINQILPKQISRMQNSTSKNNYNLPQKKLCIESVESGCTSIQNDINASKSNQHLLISSQVHHSFERIQKDDDVSEEVSSIKHSQKSILSKHQIEFTTANQPVKHSQYVQNQKQDSIERNISSEKGVKSNLQGEERIDFLINKLQSLKQLLHSTQSELMNLETTTIPEQQCHRNLSQCK